MIHPGGVTPAAATRGSGRSNKVGADYLMGVHRGQLDVERMVMHELRLPELP